ncbi:MAG TPA: J domain-containing protein [Acidimicrobiales bacterium]|nr:J domain-containing protein [Acidimicrobiales bacterium]
MDPRRLLGVGARAGRAEVRSAHRRLRRALDPTAGGTAGLVALVDLAAAVLTGGAPVERLLRPPDPSGILGLPPGGPVAAADAPAAYRRLARVVHPDRGGTDELFRVVAAAHEALTAPPAGRGSRPRHAGRRPRPSPPAPPPPRGPYRAPPPEARHVVSGWQALRELAFHGSVLVAVGGVVAGAFVVTPVLGAIAVLGALAWGAAALRASVQSVLRAVIVLLGSRVRIADAIAPERFLEDRCLDAPIGRQGERALYDAYVRWCARQPTGDGPVAPWVFVERLRTLGLLLVKPSAWEDGLWVGVTLRPTP